MSDSDDELSPKGYWPSVADLFLTLFVISIAIVAAVFCALLPTNNLGKDQALVQAVGSDLIHLRGPMNELRVALELEPVGGEVPPSRVILAHAETCRTGVEMIDLLKTQVEDLEERLKRILSGDGPELEIERLLKENSELKGRVGDLERKLDQVLRTFADDPDALAQIIQQNEDLKRQLHDKPPNIQISEQKEAYRFESGSSLMSGQFVIGLTENEFSRLAGEIVGRQEEGRVKVDTLEIIGHTDGAPLSKVGNLDQKLPEVLAREGSGMKSLSPGSNNDLGLLRALAVREQWAVFVENHKDREILRSIQVRCYSAGQTILPEVRKEVSAQDFRRPDPKARRIEMRLTRLADADSR